MLALAAGSPAVPQQFPTLDETKLTELAQTCSGQRQSDRRCWDELFRATIKQYGLEGAFDLLSYSWDQTKQLGESTCHDLTHGLGLEAYKFFARGKEFPVSGKTAYCNYGFFHGVIEAMVADKKPLALAQKFCRYIDEKIRGQAPEAFLQCFHGIGHGTVNVHDKRLWGNEWAMITPALKICDEISTNREERWRCGSGVFAGIASFYRANLYELSLNTSDPFFLCREQTRDEYAETCYRELIFATGAITGGDPAKVIALIESIPEDAYAHDTMRAWSVPYQESSPHRPIGLALCRTVPPRLRVGCIQSITRQLVQAGRPGDELAEAISFCQSPALAPSESEGCFEFVFPWNSRWITSPKREENCEAVKGDFRGECYRLIEENILR